MAEAAPEYAILQSYPEMVLISRRPFAWKGFLNCRLESGKTVRIKMKLVAPHYPLSEGTDIYFGERISRILCPSFTKRLECLTKNSRNVSTLLKQLQLLISSQMTEKDWQDDSTTVTENQALGIVEEIRDTFKFEPMEASQVRLMADSSLNTIKLTMNDVSLKLSKKKRLHDSRWIVISSDLPQIAEFGGFERNLANLHAARNKFKLQVEIFERSWRKLREIDQNCWVLDPLEPRPSHLYRRIYLTDSLSVLITLHPLNPDDLPEIKFLGCENDAREREDVVSSNAHKWDPQSGMVDNLTMLLGVAGFPRKERKKEGEEDEGVAEKRAMVMDEECCICFSLELSQEKLPNMICNNAKCRKHFHGSCLVQWLQAVPESYFFFGHIHGACPHCGENISCPV